MGDCNTCPLYQAAAIFTLTSTRRSQDREYPTNVGRLISSAATAKGLKLSAVSTRAQFAPDYVARVCRGDLPLNGRAAALIGGVLGIDLTSYVHDERKAVAPELPLNEGLRRMGIESVPTTQTTPLRFEAAG